MNDRDREYLRLALSQPEWWDDPHIVGQIMGLLLNEHILRDHDEISNFQECPWEWEEELKSLADTPGGP